LVVQLAEAHGSSHHKAKVNGILHVPWQKTMLTRRREILVPHDTPRDDVRRMRSETRATLVVSIARGRRWLDELINNSTVSAESIAQRKSCSLRQVNMTLSLAFLAPDIVKAAIEGRLPHGIGVTRLRDAPVEWSRQHAMLGLPG
jgi:hypothetical protein